jgi:hypothetical protein
MQATTFKTILGTNHGVQRSRVWIEGKRLIEAGFTQGAKYCRTVHKEKRTVVLELARPHTISACEKAGIKLYTVSGTAARPIIDIIGKVVVDTFSGTHVNVEFHKGAIVISNTNE